MTTFCLDTCGLIDAFRSYRPNVFPRLWQRLEGSVAEERAIAPEQVLEELA